MSVRVTGTITENHIQDLIASGVTVDDNNKIFPPPFQQLTLCSKINGDMMVYAIVDRQEDRM